VLDVRKPAEKMAEQYDAENPEYAAKQIIEEKLRVVHGRHPCNEWCKSADYRKIPG